MLDNSAPVRFCPFAASNKIAIEKQIQKIIMSVPTVTETLKMENLINIQKYVLNKIVSDYRRCVCGYYLMKFRMNLILTSKIIVNLITARCSLVQILNQ